MSTPIPALHIDGLDQDGRGVARHDGKVVFVHGALPGEQVSAVVYRRRRRFDEARVEQVLQASSERVTPRCEHFGICGGCSLQHLAGPAQVAHKLRDALDKLQHLAGVQPERVEPAIAGPVWGYRRKARVGCKHVPRKGGVLVGFRERGSPFIAETERCHVLVSSVGERIRALRDLLGTLEARDAIPQIEIAADDEHTVLVVRNLNALTSHDRERLRAFAIESGLAIALQPAGPNSVEALYPQALPTLSYRVEGQRLTFEVLDFVQVNAEVNEQLVTASLDALQAGPGDSVLDLFCGLGNFTIPLAARGADVLALELGSAMVERARYNARLNGVEHRVRAEVADLSDAETVRRWLEEPPRRVLIDPPRSGASEVVAALPDSGPLRLVYVSCNPATLARDAAVLAGEKSMRLLSLRVVDMFAHTNHVESLAVFERP